MANRHRPREIDAAFLEEQRLSDDLKKLDFVSVWAAASERRPPAKEGGACRACRGAFGPVLDTSNLVRGRSFVTAHRVEAGVLELRQFASTFHQDDTDTVPPMDAIAHFEALAKAEAFLLANGDPRYPETGSGRSGWVTIEKSRRPRRHGFQTIALHAKEPNWIARDREFTEKHGAGLPSWLETRNPQELLLGEFRGGIAAIVPAAPKRAFETILYCRPGTTGLLSDLTGNQRWGLAQALREVTGALRLELAVRGGPERYAWRVHTAPGLEPYVRIVAHRSVQVDDGPQEWVERLRSHIGVE